MECKYNYDNNISNNLLPYWIEFSSKSKNFDESSCYKFWKTFKSGNMSANQLTFRSLIYWAKLDNPELYEKYRCENLSKLRSETLANFYLVK